RDLPLADVALDGDVHDLAGALAEDGSADRRDGRDDREVTAAAGAGERDARADRREEERTAFPTLRILDLDDRADRDARARRERCRAEGGESIGDLDRLLRAVLLRAPEARKLVRRARVFPLLVGGGAVACIGRRSISRGEGG